MCRVAVFMLICSLVLAPVPPAGAAAPPEPLALNSTTQGSISPGQTIWYPIATPQDGDLTLKLTPTHESAAPDLRLVRPDGNLDKWIMWDFAPNPAQPAEFAAYGLEAQTYYIVLTLAQSSRPTDFTLVNAFTPAALPNDPEPNDTQAQARVLEPNATQTGHIAYAYGGNHGTNDPEASDAEDWWQVTIGQEGAFSITVQQTTVESEPGVPLVIETYLYQSGFSSVYDFLEFAGTSRGKATLGRASINPGTYFIRLRQPWPNAQHQRRTSYTLTSTFTPSRSDFPDLPPGHWAYQAVGTMLGKGIVNGYPDGALSPMPT